MVNKKDYSLILKDLLSLSPKDIGILFSYYNVNSLKDLIPRIYKKGLFPSNLFAAITEGNIDLVKEIINTPGFNIDEQNDENDNGDTVLTWAIRKTQNEIAKYLISSGANINLPNLGGYTPLFVAIVYRNNEMVKYVIDKKANIDLRDSFKNTPVIQTAIEKNNEIAKYLIDRKADLDLQNIWGYTPLFIAIDNRDYEMIKYLIDHGAKFDKKALQLMNMDIEVLSYLVNENVKIPKEYRNKIPQYIYLKVQDLKKQIDILKKLMILEEQDLIEENPACISEDIEELEKCIETEKEMIKYRPGGEKEKELEEKYKEHPYFRKNE